MNCHDIKRNLSVYLDGELSQAGRDAFFDHLQCCESCCDLVGEASFQEAALVGLLKQPMAAPASIRYNVLSAISREAARPARVPVWRRAAWRPATAMAAVLALAGTGWRTFTGSLQAPIPVADSQVSPSHAAPALAPRPSSSATRIAAVPPAPAARPAVRPTAARPEKPKPAPKAPVEPSPTPKPRAPKAPDDPAPSPTSTPRLDEAVGVVTMISTPGNVMNGRFLARTSGTASWLDAPSNLRSRTHLRSADETVVTVELRDGTVVKANQRTEWVIQRSPTKEDPTWGIRLIRGEIWIRAVAGVNVDAPNVQTETRAAEFGLRSVDGEDATVLVAAGTVNCRNAQGASQVSAGEAGVTVAGEAPRAAFAVDDARGQMEWAYAPAPAFRPADDMSY